MRAAKMPRKRKNPHAQALARKKWAQTTAADRSAHGKKMIGSRWRRARAAAKEAEKTGTVGAQTDLKESTES